MGCGNVRQSDGFRDRAEMDVSGFADMRDVYGHGSGGNMGSYAENRDLNKCSDCGGADLSPPKDCFGNNLPYGHGLVDCSIRGVGYYPFQYNSCSEYHKK